MYQVIQVAKEVYGTPLVVGAVSAELSFDEAVALACKIAEENSVPMTDENRQAIYDDKGWFTKDWSVNICIQG